MPSVLLVEDNECNRDMLSRRLVRLGWDVAIAVDGPRGLEMARQRHFDLVLMDMSLPGKDGWTVTQELKSDPATRDIPVMALTAHAMASDRDRAIAVGCDDFETKPVDFAGLLRKMERLTQQVVAG